VGQGRKVPVGRPWNPSNRMGGRKGRREGRREGGRAYLQVDVHCLPGRYPYLQLPRHHPSGHIP
jgi:hypothetical protein